MSFRWAAAVIFLILAIEALGWMDWMRSAPLTVVQENTDCDHSMPKEQAFSAVPGAVGVDPVYLEILKEAKRRSSLDYETTHKRGERGVIIGPTEGEFGRYTLKALQNGRRIRNVLAGDQTVKLALMTSQEHIDVLQKCSDSNYFPTHHYHREACQLWANDTLFDDVIATKEGEFRANENNTNPNNGASQFKLKVLGRYRNAPYKTSLFLDSDAYPCPGFEKIFALTKPFSEKLWQLPSTATVDVVAGVDQFPSGDGNPTYWTPGDPSVLKDFQYMSERNGGVVMFNFHQELVQTFAHFLPLVSEHVYNNVATPERQVIGDQTPFRVALYVFDRLQPDFNHQLFPMHVSCRTYPGKGYAGIDGFKNGMYLMQQDGKPCKECHCTPCLINHNGHDCFVNINGRKGWEDDFVYKAV